MKYRFYFKNMEVADYNAVIASYQDSDFNSVFTSTLPLLEYWKEYISRVEELFDSLNYELSNEVKFCFEHKTPSWNGNKGSFTDLMIYSGNCKIAIEAKYTEGARGKEEIIEEWLDNSMNKVNVFEYWKDLIQPFSNVTLDIEDAREIKYQMLHRTASACYQNNHMAAVVYQLFCDDRNNNLSYKKELQKLSNWISPSENLEFFVQFIQLSLRKQKINSDYSENLTKSKIYSFMDENKKNIIKLELL